MKIVYKNLDYLLVDESFTSNGFKHNFLLFVNDGFRKAYAVQMAVNYISTLPQATFSETLDQQHFVACLPITEYPEVLDYLTDKSVAKTTSQLAHLEAERLKEIVTKLLNGDKTVAEAELLDRLYKLTQHKRLLEIENIDFPQSVFDFEELYHTYLMHQRLYKTNFRDQMKHRRIVTSLRYFTRFNQFSEANVLEIKTLMTDLIQFRKEINDYRYSWLTAVDDDIKWFESWIVNIGMRL